MAEIVEYRKEKILPEYEQMKRIELFDDAEIRDIIKRRDALNAKIVRQNKDIRDYLEFIKYERNLIGRIQKLRKDKNIQEKKGNIEYAIALRIKQLYIQATDRFPQNVRIWEEFLKFAKVFKVKDISTILDRMIQLHGDKPEMWLRAVVWEYEQTQNMERVKHFMLGGLQRHPDNNRLYYKFLKIKLMEAEKIKVLTESGLIERNHILEGAKIIYDNSRKKIHNIEYLVNILEIVQEYSFAQDLHSAVLRDMQSDFPLEELMWHTLARRELMGLHMVTDHELEADNQFGGNTDEASTKSKSTPKKRIECCVAVYEQAARILKTEKMWSYYINTMLELNQDTSAQASLKKKVLQMALKGGYEAGFLSESHYIYYIEQIFKAQDTRLDFILEVFDKATKSHGMSVRLWEMWMRFHIQNESEQSLYEVFRQAVRKLGDKSSPLWQLIIQYYQVRPDLPKRVEEIFNEAILQPPSVSAPLKAQYIEYVAITKDINAARHKYDDLVLNTTPCLEIHEKMSFLESIQCIPNVDSWRKCHENAVRFFGEQQVDVWIEYIKFEKTQDTPKNINLIYERALKTLNVDLVNTFEVKHDLLNIV
ncbi:U3 small nucleolar RNA-associated protein 6 homolog [Phlebotomus argentipes]|uniref:U3 small nucleolar RNA-associated protein 6 homolog n=1 Tax=Phlebotomus argentipes TaxID=94469 RepID=UPI002892C050|nr:U3 small nucleolar RNA-associated protein 6 homolog [Phlebotomus argentipes]